MPTWDKGRPIGAEAWNLGGVRVRDNFDYLDAALKQIATFAQNPSNPTTNMFNKIAIGLLASRPNLAAAAQTGVIYFATDNGRWYVCTDGALNTWVETTSVGGALAIAGALTVTGLITANGGLTVPGGQNLTAAGPLLINAGATLGGGSNLTVGAGDKIITPVENWLRQSGVDMNPHFHGNARHRYQGAEPWSNPPDLLTNLINVLKQAADVTPEVLTVARTNKCPLTLNTTGRTGNSSVLLIAMATFDGNGNNNDHASSFHIARGTTALSAESLHGQGGNASISPNTIMAWALDTACPSGATSTYQIRAVEVSGDSRWLGGTLLMIDLGQTA